METISTSQGIQVPCSTLLCCLRWRLDTEPMWLEDIVVAVDEGWVCVGVALEYY